MNNPSEINIISRLILQKIMSSDASQYLESYSLKTLNETFLSEMPERKQISLRFGLKDKDDMSKSDWDNHVANFAMDWRGDGEIVDTDGNVWVPNKLNISVSMASMYSGTLESFGKRVDCLNAIMDLLDEVGQISSKHIKIMTMNNEQRVERDAKIKKQSMVDFLCNLLKHNAPWFRHNLRTNGKGRIIPRNSLADKVEPGVYEIVLNDGSKRCPKIKRYSIFVPENSTYGALLKRLE